MEDSQYLIYEEFSPVEVNHGNEVSYKLSSISNNLHCSSSLVLPPLYVASTHNPQYELSKSELSSIHVIKEVPSSLTSEPEGPDAKSSKLNLLSSNSVISLPDQSILHEVQSTKIQEANTSIQSVDNNSSYRLVLAPFSYQTILKNGNTDKLLAQTMLPSDISSTEANHVNTLGQSVPCDKDETLADVSHNCSSSPLSSLSSIASSISKTDSASRGMKNSSQILVKFLQEEDLNLDVVKVIGHNLDNSFEIVDKETNKPIKIKGSNFNSHSHSHFRPQVNGEIMQQFIVGIDEMEPNCSSVFTCIYCNTNFDNSALLHNHQEKECVNNTSIMSSKELNIINKVECILASESKFNIDLNKPYLKPIELACNQDMCWSCIICSLEFFTAKNLKDHYTSHSTLELSEALLNCTKPYHIQKYNVEKNVDPPSIAGKKSSYKSKNNVGILSNIHLKSSEKKDNKKIIIPSEIQRSNSSPVDENPNKNVREVHLDSPRSKVELQSNLCKKLKTTSKNSRSVGSGPGSRDPHPCPVCKKVLSSRGNLAKHLIQHQQKKPWVCKICFSDFNSKRNYDHHFMQKHTNLRPCVCSICGKGYINKRTLAEHMAFHGQEKPFACKLCGKKFITNKCVKRHMHRHETTKKYVCEICYKAFRVRVDLLNHKKVVHKSDTKSGKAKLTSSKLEISTSVSSHHNIPEQQLIEFTNSSSNNTYLKSQNNKEITEQQLVEILPMHDQPNRIREISELLLHTSSNNTLPDLNNEIDSSNLGVTKDSLFISGPSIDVPSLITVNANTYDPEQNNDSFELRLSRKNSIVSPHLEMPQTFVMIGLSDIKSERTSQHVLHSSQNYAPIYNELAASLEPSKAPAISAINLLNDVTDNIPRNYSQEIELSL